LSLGVAAPDVYARRNKALRSWSALRGDKNGEPGRRSFLKACVYLNTLLAEPVLMKSFGVWAGV
jgi:hypothetical protein